MSFAIPDKLSFVLFTWTCAFLLPWEINLAIIFLIVLLEFTAGPFKPVSNVSHKYFTRFLAYSILFLAVLVAVNGFLLHEGSLVFRIPFIQFYSGGIHYGLTVSIRLVVLSLSVLLFFVSVRLQEFAQYLQTAGLPNTIVSIVLLTLYYLEQLPHRISMVFTAQEARGAPVRKGLLSRARAFFVILSPLILSSIVESVERGVALELRGYRSNRPGKKSVKPAKAFRPWRYGFIVLSCIIIIISIARWLSR